MPVVRKLIKLGGSKGFTIPEGWLAYYEEKYGAEITHVLAEYDDSIVIKVKPPRESDAGTSVPRKEDGR